MDNQVGKRESLDERRKRVQRMKTFIILTALGLLFLSIILNFVLLFRVMNLQSKINELYSVTTDQITELYG